MHGYIWEGSNLLPRPRSQQSTVKDALCQMSYRCCQESNRLATVFFRNCFFLYIFQKTFCFVIFESKYLSIILLHINNNNLFHKTIINDGYIYIYNILQKKRKRKHVSALQKKKKKKKRKLSPCVRAKQHRSKSYHCKHTRCSKIFIQLIAHVQTIIRSTNFEFFNHSAVFTSDANNFD